VTLIAILIDHTRGRLTITSIRIADLVLGADHRLMLAHSANTPVDRTKVAVFTVNNRTGTDATGAYVRLCTPIPVVTGRPVVCRCEDVAVLLRTVWIT
jgi:hypothetical protein